MVSAYTHAHYVDAPARAPVVATTPRQVDPSALRAIAAVTAAENEQSRLAARESEGKNSGGAPATSPNSGSLRFPTSGDGRKSASAASSTASTAVGGPNQVSEGKEMTAGAYSPARTNANGCVTVSSPSSNGQAAARPRAPTAQRTRRLKDLRKSGVLSSLEVQRFDLLDLPSVSEYDLYARRLGGSFKQVLSQTNEDARSMETQTTETTFADQSVQAPEDMGYGNGSGSAGDDAGENSKHFAAFLHRAAQACEVLLEENLERALDQGRRICDEGKPITNEFDGQVLKVESGTTTLPCPAFLAGRPVVDVCFSEAKAHIVLVAYGPPGEGGQVGERKNGTSGPWVVPVGLLCLWDTNQPSAPIAVLMCHGHPTCCILSPGRSHIAMAGTDEGTVALWDTRETVRSVVREGGSDIAATMLEHSGVDARSFPVPPRPPTFSTEAVSIHYGKADRESTRRTKANEQVVGSSSSSTPPFQVEASKSKVHAPLSNTRVTHSLGGRVPSCCMESCPLSRTRTWHRPVPSDASYSCALLRRTSGSTLGRTPHGHSAPDPAGAYCARKLVVHQGRTERGGCLQPPADGRRQQRGQRRSRV